MLNILASFAVQHDLRLVLTAVGVCLSAALCVFRVRGRMRQTRGGVRGAWIFLAGLEAGAGIWAAVFIATLAFKPGVDSGYDPVLTMGSLLFSVLASTGALATAWTGRDDLRKVAAALLLALAIACTHYMGFAAFKLRGHVEIDPIRVWASVVLAFVAGTVALFVSRNAKHLSQQMAGAVSLSVGILGLHFLGMSAAHIAPDPTVALPSAVLSDTVVGFAVLTIAFLIILGGLGAAYIDDEASASAVRRIRRLADAAREGIVVVSSGAIVDANTAFTELAGRALPELLNGRLLGELMTLEAGGGDIPLEVPMQGWVRTASGEQAPVEIFARVLAEAYELASGLTVVTVRDLREQRLAEDRIRFLADHDKLTGLMNRDALMVAVQRMVEAAAGERAVMLCTLNVDNSKEINELYGQAVGDALLCKIAERMKRYAVEPNLAGRLGGNNFAYAAFGEVGTGVAAAEAFLVQFCASLRRPFQVDGVTVEPVVSFGVSGHPMDADSAEQLLLHADAALQQARAESTGDRIVYYKEESQKLIREQRDLVRALKAAIDTSAGLSVFYQPQARTADGELAGFEALVRWTHPERGLMSPAVFIPLAEESGLIAQLGEWVLRQACAEAASWPKPVTIAVNLSPHQVCLSNLPTLVHEVLIETGLSPGRLELEITESALFHDEQRALDTLRRLKALGVKIAMDDFGTGFSSLSTLHSFPFDKIKIDKSFVEGIGTLERSTVIVRAVLGIGRGLNIPVVAEGVETEAQLAFLRAEQCAEVQGYLIGKPAPADQNRALFAAMPVVVTGAAPAPRPRRKRAA